jgi:hypothetical protein
LQFAVIQPDTPGQRALDSVKRAALRNLCSPALLWSIEVGAESGRLHLNLLGPDLRLPDFKRATSHVSQVRHGARAAGAYMHKRDAMPAAIDYAGRIAGTAGTIMEYLAHAKALPVAQAGSLLKIIETARFNREPLKLSPPETRKDLRALAQQFIDRLDTIEQRARANMLK